MNRGGWLPRGPKKWSNVLEKGEPGCLDGCFAFTKVYPYTSLNLLYRLTATMLPHRLLVLSLPGLNVDTEKNDSIELKIVKHKQIQEVDSCFGDFG